MSNYPEAAKTFIREAKDAIARMEIAQDKDDLDRALISFLNATKHSIIQLQTDFRSSLKEFDEWYQAQVEKMSKNSLCNFFYTWRNNVTKKGKKLIVMGDMKLHVGIQPFVLKGPLKIGPNGIMKKIIKEKAYEWEPVKNVPGIEISWRFAEYPEGYSEKDNPITICKSYVEILDSILDDFISRFD